MNKWTFVKVLGLVVLAALIVYLIYSGSGEKTIATDVVFAPEREVVEEKDVDADDDATAISEKKEEPKVKKAEKKEKKKTIVKTEKKKKVEVQVKKEEAKEEVKVEVEKEDAIAKIEKAAKYYYPFVFYCADEDCKKIEKINLNCKEAK